MPRPSTARRGRGNFKGNNTERESALKRLGKAVMPNSVNYNERNLKQKYKFVRNVTVSHSVVTLPAEQRVRTVTKKFVKSYYDTFDQPGRQNLESFYGNESFFSFSATHPMPTIGRNLLEVHEPQQRLSMLIHDGPNIAQTLATFSPTEHIENCMTIDIPYYLADPMSVTSIHTVVTGVFRDTSAQTNPLRAFTRVFVLKHVSTDKEGEATYKIFNDIFMLQPPTADQIKRFHQGQLALKRLSGLDKANSSTSNALQGLQTRKEREESLIKIIMAKTRMNRHGSSQLLQESDWDEDKAMLAFNVNYAKNMIPQEFFTP